MISLIIPTYRNPKYLDICLQSALENLQTDAVPSYDISNSFEVVVVVDGFLSESRAVLDKYKMHPSLKIIELEENMGMQYALNIGVMQANHSWVLIANDDNVFCKYWPSRLNCIYYALNERGVFTINQVEPEPSIFDFIVHDFGSTIETFDYAKWLEWEYQYPKTQNTPNGRIFPFLMQKVYYMGCGGIDTLYDSPNIVDWDFFLKLELLGFHFERLNDIRFYHFGSVATKKNAESVMFKERETKAYATYLYKWGIPPTNGINNTKLPSNGLFRGFAMINWKKINISGDVTHD
jgi:glycosyltransferase involved in cell wall biosynthesis